jgi:hypothetical protein
MKNALPRVLILSAWLLCSLSCRLESDKTRHLNLSADDLLISTNGEVRIITIDTGDERVLIDLNHGTAFDAVPSPDGSMIAFAVLPNGNQSNGNFGTDIYIANRDGSSIRKVVDHGQVSEFLRYPNWLYDNQTLIFQVEYRDNSTGEIVQRIDRVQIDDSERTLYLKDALLPSVTHNGWKLVFHRWNSVLGLQELWTADADLSDVRRVLDATDTRGFIGLATISPDGALIAFGGDSTVAAGRGDYRRLDDWYGWWPVYATVTALRHGPLQDLWIVGIDGSGLRRLSELEEDDPSLSWNGSGTGIYAMGKSGLVYVESSDGRKVLLFDGRPHSQVAWLSRE